MTKNQDAPKKNLSLIDENKNPKHLEKIKCNNCGNISKPYHWPFRTGFGILYLFAGSLIIGLIYFAATKPYVCRKCGQRDKLVKILNDHSEIKLNGLSTKQFKIINYIVLPFAIISLLLTLFGLIIE